MRIVKGRKPLKLTNDGKLEMFFIGTGTAFSKKLFNTNFIIIKGDTHLMVDFGITGPVALRKNAGLDVSEIDNIFLTHSHADHIGGVEYLALYNRYIPRKGSSPKLNIIISEKYQEILWNMSLRGGMEWNETNSNGEKLVFGDYFEPIRPVETAKTPREIMQCDFGGIQLEIFSTNHIPDVAKNSNQAFSTYGIFVDNRVFISGDTKFDKKLINSYADKSEVMFHDASFFKNPVHTSTKELTSLPESVRKKMYLMHYSDDWKNYDVTEFAGLAKEGYRYIFD